MTKTTHYFYIGILSAIVVATFGLLIYAGTSYYLIPLEERYFHDNHQAFKPSGIIGHGLGIFGSISALLSYEDVLSRFAVVRSGLDGDQTGGHRRPTGVPGLEPVRPELAEEVFRGTTAAIMPSYGYDSRDDPFDPNRGKRFISRIRFAGGPLGGDYDYVRPELHFTAFKGLGKKVTLGLNLEVGQFFTYNESDLPIYERYRLGGDRTIRGIPYYTVVPRTEDGAYFLTQGGSQQGGDRDWLANFEWQLRVGGPVKIVFFADLGNTYHELQGWDWGVMRKTTGVELRVFLPMFQAPIRFIYGYNLDPFPEEEQSDFQFSIGTTF